MQKSLPVKNILPAALIIIFSLISAYSLIFQGDDFIWYFVNDIDEMSGYRVPNGRYFTNFLTYIMVGFPLMKYLIYCGALSALIILISHLVDYEKKSAVLKYGLTFTMFILLPTAIYSNTITWISGFTNYVISILITLVYIFFCFKIIFDKMYTPSKIWIILSSLLGFAGALCVENISIYNVLFGIFSIILIFRLRKKFFASNILFLLTSLIGFIVMMSADAYGEVFDSNQIDSLGIRKVEVSFSDVFMQIYQSVGPFFARDFFVIHILVAFCFVLLYYKTDRSGWDASKSRYAKICINITVLYAAYSVWVNCFEDFVQFDFGMKMRALETAFVFIYLISLIYLAFNLLERSKFLRFTIYLVSSVVVVAPFAMVNPVSPRCFLADAVFWILLTGELFFACYEKFTFFRSNELKNSISIVAVLSGILMSNMNISNKIWNDIRFDYIKEQMNDNKKMIEIIELPYTDLAQDDLGSEQLFTCYILDDISYTDLLFKFYDLEINKDSFKHMYISPLDYNTSMS